MAAPLKFSVPPEDSGTRLDVWLARNVDGMTRSAVTRALEQGRVEINGNPPKKAGQAVCGGDVVCLSRPGQEHLPSVAAEPIPLDVVHQDADLIVVNKAAGMVVHPAPGHPRGTLVNAVAHHIAADLPAELHPAEYGVARPGIVHRLDRETSGLLVVAKTRQALLGLQAQFRAHSTERVYLAVVSGPRIDDAGTLKTLFGRSRRDRKRMTGKVTEGKVAVTHWEVLRRSRAFALLMLRLETGRTHQIRVHMAESGHPVVGDRVYGRPVPKGQGGNMAGELAAARRMDRQALHAAVLGLSHPQTDERMRFVCRPPHDMEVLVRRCFGETALEEVMEEIAG